MASCSIASRIDYERFSCINRLLRTTAWIESLQRKYKKSTEHESPQRAELSPADIVHAEETLVRHVQEDLHLDVNQGKYKELLPTVENGIIVVGGRAERWISSTWNREKFILLPVKHHSSFLVVEKLTLILDTWR